MPVHWSSILGFAGYVCEEDEFIRGYALEGYSDRFEHAGVC